MRVKILFSYFTLQKYDKNIRHLPDIFGKNDFTLKGNITAKSDVSLNEKVSDKYQKTFSILAPMICSFPPLIGQLQIEKQSISASGVALPN